MRIFWLVVITLSVALLLFCCDIYESENKDWENEVTIYFKNSTNCPLYFYLDGISKGRVEMQADYTENDVGQGIHLLEAYPWNSSQYSCDFIYTQALENPARFEWELTETSPCNICKPTPTPAPTSVISPTPTIPPTATPVI